MKMYKGDLVAEADKEQLETLLAAGWEKEAPAKKEVEAPVQGAASAEVPASDAPAGEEHKKVVHAKRDLGK